MVQNSSQTEYTGSTAVEQQPPLILFGSSFPNDRHFTQVSLCLFYVTNYNYS